MLDFSQSDLLEQITQLAQSNFSKTLRLNGLTEKLRVFGIRIAS